MAQPAATQRVRSISEAPVFRLFAKTGCCDVALPPKRVPWLELPKMWKSRSRCHGRLKLVIARISTLRSAESIAEASSLDYHGIP
jgi:hypothetical protein